MISLVVAHGESRPIGVNPMGKNERTGKGVGSIASQGLRNPGSLTNRQIKTIAASALTQLLGLRLKKAVHYD